MTNRYGLCHKAFRQSAACHRRGAWRGGYENCICPPPPSVRRQKLYSKPSVKLSLRIRGNPYGAYVSLDVFHQLIQVRMTYTPLHANIVLKMSNRLGSGPLVWSVMGSVLDDGFIRWVSL
jgi:hypothetical protein